MDEDEMEPGEEMPVFFSNRDPAWAAAAETLPVTAPMDPGDDPALWLFLL